MGLFKRKDDEYPADEWGDAEGYDPDGAYEPGEYADEYAGEYSEDGFDYDGSYDEGGSTEYDYQADSGRGRGSEYDPYGDLRESTGTPGILYVLLGVIAALALAAVIFALITLIGGRNTEDKPSETPLVTEEPAMNAPETVPGELPGGESGLPAEGTEPVEPAGTPEPTGKAAELDANGAIVPSERGPVVPEREKKRTLESFVHACYIGNSFVNGMQLWSDIELGDYVCADGVSLDNMIGNYLYYTTVRSYDEIYITVGLNEIGWPVDTFIEKYEKVIDYIRSDAYDSTRTATIYITSIMPAEKIMETTPAESGSPIHLATILEFNERLKDMCQRKGCWYLDVYSALADAEGYLPDEIGTDDHIHFEKTGYRIWTDYMLNHYVDESLTEVQ